MRRQIACFVAVTVLIACCAVGSSKMVDRVLARLNGDIVTETDLREAGITKPTRQDMKAWFDKLLLLQQARKMQIGTPEDEVRQYVEKTVSEIRSRYPSEAAFRQDLAANHMSIEKLKRNLEKKAGEDYLIFKAVSRRYNLTGPEARQQPAAPEPAPSRTGKVHLVRLAVAVEGSGDEAQQKALAKVSGLFEKMNSQGTAFAEGAQRFSEAPSDLGVVRLSQLAPEVREAVESLQPGRASQPVVTGGYAQVFYIVPEARPRDPAFEKRFNQARETLLQELRRNARLEVYDPALQKVIPREYQKR